MRPIFVNVSRPLERAAELATGVPSLRRATYLVCGALAAFIFLSASSEATAQESSTRDARHTFLTRSAIEEQAATAERLASDPKAAPEAREFHRGEAWLLRRRLELGDFAVGDRIVVTVAGEAALTDTFTVRPGPELHMSNLPPLSLGGVLRSEVESHIGGELGRYIHQPHVTAMPLLRVAVLGPVGRPGYYHVPADMLLTDLVMTAGGPGGGAEQRRFEIRRGDDALYSHRDVRIALNGGMSLDMLSLRSGDEFLIREPRRTNWVSVIQFASLAAGAVTLVLRFTH